MARAVVITNPLAARTTDAALHQASEVLRHAGWRLEVLPIAGPGDARRFALEAVSSGVDLLVVQGGDGTTMQAATALVGTEIPLGLIPSGTGNLLAGNLRIPRHPGKAARLLLEGLPRRIDLGKVPRGDRDLYFGVAAGTGADARVMGETRQSLKRRLGIGAYISTVLRILPEIRNASYRITVDGRAQDTRAALVLVANCGEVIPGLIRLGPRISPADGLLDLVTVRANGAIEAVRAVWEVLRGLSSRDGVSSLVGYGRGRVITVESETPEPFETDGDPDGSTPFTAEIVPGAIVVLQPSDQGASP